MNTLFEDFYRDVNVKKISNQRFKVWNIIFNKNLTGTITTRNMQNFTV